MAELDLFTWWAISITGGSVFLTIVSIYLYLNSRKKRERSIRVVLNTTNLMKDFVFIWVLLSLLVLYIVSINRGSFTLFALGNIIVEVVLIAYVVKNMTKKSES